jgi:hypothetical protein
MKKILCSAVAAIALVGVAAPAAAQTSQLHYAGGPFTQTNPSGFELIGSAANEVAIAAGIGTRYTANTFAQNSNTNDATPSVTTTFTLSGTVTPDCSFYAGNGSGATNLNFGQIGVRTGNNENVSSAFDMRAPAVAIVNTATAGCNFNNEVYLEKSSAQGMVNAAVGLDYDNTQFQANIPYSVKASWVGVNAGAGSSNGGPKDLEVSTTGVNATKAQGAWRSGMTLVFTAPAADNALVAGSYSGTTKLVLRPRS